MGVVFSSIGLVILVLALDAGASAGELGVAFSLTASGGFIGALLAPWLRARLRPGVLMLAFGWCSAAVAAAIVVLRSPYALGIAGAVAFLLYPAVNAVVFGHLAATVPDRVQGRVNAAVRAAIYAAALVALAIAATLTKAIRTQTG